MRVKSVDNGFRLIPENDSDRDFLLLWDQLNQKEGMTVEVFTNLHAEFVVVEWNQDDNLNNL
jgi:hypothetical protein